jgi:hypothetical protein
VAALWYAKPCWVSAQTDYTKQRLLLKATIAMMVRHRIGDERARQVLAKVAQTHNRSGYNIQP